MKTLSAWLPATVLLKNSLPIEGPYSGLTNDSRSVRKGSLFFCIKGTQLDGHKFIDEVNQKGASAVVIEDPSLFEKVPNAILVTNSREAYALACSSWFGSPSKNTKVIAVTGTNGKTTTTFLTAEVLERHGWNMGLLGTVEIRTGNHTVPSTLTTPDAWALQESLTACVKSGMRAVTLEASSIALDQHRLTGTQIEVAVFTNLTQDHLDYHKTWENYFLAKKRLFLQMNPRHCVVNIDDEWGKRLANEVPKEKLITFSLQSGVPATLSAYELKLDALGTRGKIREGDEVFEFTISQIGQHNIANALSAVGVARALGIPLSQIAPLLENLKGAPGRLERVPLPEGAPQVFVDYAHSPDALEKVTQTLKALRPPTGRLITVFGAGGDRDKTKRPLMAKAAIANSDLVVVTSDNPRTENPDSIIGDIIPGFEGKSFHRETDRRRAIELALTFARETDLVLVAGKGHETYQIVGKEKIDFDDRQVVSEAYAAQNRVLP